MADFESDTCSLYVHYMFITLVYKRGNPTTPNNKLTASNLYSFRHIGKYNFRTIVSCHFLVKHLLTLT